MGVKMRYENVVQALYETPWAIRPGVLASMIELVHLRADGGRLDEEAIRERIESADYFHTESDIEARARDAAVGGRAVAVLSMYGVIFPKAGLFGRVSGGTSLEVFRRQLAEAVNDDTISTIVLDVDSPGGSVDMVPETAIAIRNANNTKPVVAVANTMAASAAYWLASQAGKLYVTPSGKVGSIGVFTAHDDLSKAMDMKGVKTTLISAGKFKVEGNPFEPLSDEARAYAQRAVDSYYRMFTADVAVGRGADVKAVRAGFGQGRMVTAADAEAQGMVDGIATLRDVVLGSLEDKPVAASDFDKAKLVGRVLTNYISTDATIASKNRRTDMHEFLTKMAEALDIEVEFSEDPTDEEIAQASEAVLTALSERPAPDPEPEPEEPAEAFTEAFPEEAAKLRALEEKDRLHEAENSVRSIDEAVLKPRNKAMSPAVSEQVRDLLLTFESEQAREVVEVISKVLETGSLVDLQEYGAQSPNGGGKSAAERLEAIAFKLMEDSDSDLSFRDAMSLALEEHPELGKEHVRTAPRVTSDEED